MKIRLEKIEYSRKFLDLFSKLSLEIREKAGQREKIFKEDPFDPRLDTHKLRGKYASEWSYSVDFKYRIRFIFLGSDKVLYLKIGTHDEIYR